MKYTKLELRQAMYMLLADVLPEIECEKIKKEGNANCDRCDDCMFEQYIKKAQRLAYTSKNNEIYCKVCQMPIERGYCSIDKIHEQS